MEDGMRADDSNPHPTENSAVPLIQMDPFFLTPNRKDTEYPAWLSPSSSKSLFRGFEKPSFFRIAILTALCLITYPAFYFLTLVAKDKSLFVVRIIVSLWCSGVGFTLGYILLKTGAQHLEAATWATVIHMSYEGDGMKLRDLAGSSRNPTSFVPAFWVLWSRFWSRETARLSRKSYDKRPWSLFLVFFVVIATLAPLLPFIFGRIVAIETFVSNKRKVYREVLIAGDLSKEDVRRVETRGWFFLTGRTSFDTAEFVYNNDTVYFAQPTRSQFAPGGSGAGTFNQLGSIGLKGTTDNILESADRSAPKTNTGVVLRYPQWGIRIHCEKLPDPEVNLVPLSSQNFTYAFFPLDFMQELFGVYGLDLPVLLGDFLDENDTLPSNLNISTISYIMKLLDDGEGFNLRLMYTQVGDQEATSLETFILRLDTEDTPSGRFPVSLNKSLPHADRVKHVIGYDAAVCLQRWEPWIIEAYNTSIASPSALRIVGKGTRDTSLLPSGNIQGAPIENTRYLNTTGKELAFGVTYDNSLSKMVKEISRNSDYIPSPTAVSFTEGTGPFGYVELSKDLLAVTRARVGAAYTLPYTAGSAPVVAQLYEDETLAYATYKEWQLAILPIIVWILGAVGELFVPKLPLNIPRREFGIYSWLALLQSQELRFEAARKLDKFASLDELEEKFSDKRVKFAVGKGEI